MKKYFSLLILIALLLTVVGCGTPTTSKDGKVINLVDGKAKQEVITVWMDDTDGTYIEDKIIPAFEAANPGIKVNFQHMGTVDAREKLKTFGQAGFGADVFQFPHDHMAQAILDDLVYPLPDELKDKLEDRMMPVAMNIASSCYDDATKSFECTAGVDKKLFAVPISIESITIYYNKALVAEEDLPTTFEELFADAEAYALANDGKRYFSTGSHWADAYFLQFIYGAFGWNPFGPSLSDPSAVGFADTASQDAIEWMIDELKPVVTGNANHDSIAGNTLFEEGNLPFVVAGPWSTQTYRDADIDYGSITFPTIDGNQPKTFAGAQMVAVYKYSDYKHASTLFVEFLQSNEAAQMLYETSGDCPALNDEILGTLDGVKTDEIISVMLEQLETSVPMPTIPEVTYYWGPAETMIKNIWNSSGNIAVEAANAERSYKASKDLAS